MSLVLSDEPGPQTSMLTRHGAGSGPRKLLPHAVCCCIHYYASRGQGCQEAAFELLFIHPQPELLLRFFDGLC